eukprot:3863479-Amphidinium_carterae.1
MVLSAQYRHNRVLHVHVTETCAVEAETPINLAQLGNERVSADRIATSDRQARLLDMPFAGKTSQQYDVDGYTTNTDVLPLDGVHDGEDGLETIFQHQAAQLVIRRLIVQHSRQLIVHVLEATTVGGALCGRFAVCVQHCREAAKHFGGGLPATIASTPDQPSVYAD